MMHLRVDPATPAPDAIDLAAGAILRGDLVVVPTDTFYGLAADPHNPRAVERLFELKGRPASQPMPLIASDLEQVERHSGPLGGLAARLAAAFWPGPLTLLVRAWPLLVPAVHGESGAVGVRVPDSAVARAVARAAGFPLIATSANVSGEPATADPRAIAPAVTSGVAVFLDAGRTPGGLPSTIVDVRGDGLVLVRAGVVPWSRVLELASGS
jgi:L-threonylcarbamoyladenylate synthase